VITFDQTLESVQRIFEHLKSVEEVDNQLESVRGNLEDFAEMLAYAHQREFTDVEEALSYIDKVLLPQLKGIMTALTSGTQDPLKRLSAASDLSRRLVANLELVTGASGDIS
jgi:CRISPR/Cas system CSM-associated protein Csm2 small subunit